MKLNGKLIILTLILVAITTACKFFFGPNLAWSGFSPVIAIALFAGMIIRDKSKSFLLPLLALILSDVIIEVLYRMDLFVYGGFYQGQLLNYSILLVSTLIGWLVKGRSHARIFAGAVLAPTVFFLLSNLSMWMGAEAYYSQDLSGLLTCYAAALPFYKNALIATLVFLPLILLTYNYLARQKVELILPKA